MDNDPDKSAKCQAVVNVRFREDAKGGLPPQEAPHHFASMNLQVLGLGIVSTALLFILAAIPWRLFKLMPPPAWIFIMGTLASLFFLHLGPQNLINVPGTTQGHAMQCRRAEKAGVEEALWRIHSARGRMLEGLLPPDRLLAADKAGRLGRALVPGSLRCLNSRSARLPVRTANSRTSAGQRP